MEALVTDEGHRIIILDRIRDPFQDNVDVKVELRDGRQYVATFFTLSNLEWLFEKNCQTGECASGLYLWATDMILVKQLTPEVIMRTVLELLRVDELEGAFTRVRLTSPKNADRHET